jgi:hypothetical protein
MDHPEPRKGRNRNASSSEDDLVVNNGQATACTFPDFLESHPPRMDLVWHPLLVGVIVGASLEDGFLRECTSSKEGTNYTIPCSFVVWCMSHDPLRMATMRTYRNYKFWPNFLSFHFWPSTVHLVGLSVDWSFTRMDSSLQTVLHSHYWASCELNRLWREIWGIKYLQK